MNKCFIVIMIWAVATLLGCGSSPKPQVNVPLQKNGQGQTVASDIQLHKLVERLDGLPKNHVHRELLSIARQSMAVKQPENCLKILLAVFPEVEILRNEYREQALVCWQAIDKTAIKDALFDHTQQSEQAELSIIKAYKAQTHDDFLWAALHFFNANDTQHIDLAWQSLQRATSNQLARLQAPFSVLTPWVSLTQWLRETSRTQNDLTTKLSHWRARYPTFPLPSTITSITLSETLKNSPQSPKRYAVLLPLSGDYAAQGKVIQDGLLTRFLIDSSEFDDIEFFDTNQLSEIEVATAANQADIIIGPLMRENVSKILPLLDSNIPVLALNRPLADSELTTATERYFFAMKVEDEAVQLAEIIAQRGHQMPLIMASGGATSARMLSAFKQRWQQLQQQSELLTKPMIVRYDDRKSMRDNLSKALDVKQSKERVQKIENLVTEKLYSVPRNRKDIDAIVLFANAQDTGLLNPIIEASISPFSDPIPVYAGSRSASGQNNKNSLRDLRGLYYVDLPWMIEQNQGNRLWQQSKKIWPSRSNSLMRLYAFGYDALLITKNMQHLRRFPAHQLSFLTGLLSINQQGFVQRSLAMGEIRSSGVRSVELAN